MTSGLRKEVLQSFKKLHRTRQNVLKGDTFALNAARVKINADYKNNKNVQDHASIAQLVQFSKDVEYELRTTVIQAVEIKPGVYEARITKDTQKLDNMPFKDVQISSK